MAIDLPPALPPQLVEDAAVQAAASAGARKTYEQFTLYLDTDPPCLTDGTLAVAVENAESLSDVVRNIARSCFAAGYPSSQIVYARVGDSVYVSAEDRVVARIDVPEAYAGYFSAVAGEPLDDNTLERRRALAGIKADRSGEALQLEWTQADDGRVTLGSRDMGSKPSGKLTPQAGNLGNRFVGRYVGALEFEQGFARSWLLSGAARSALGGLNDRDDAGRADDYNEQQFGLSRVTPWGIFGLDARLVQFEDIENAAQPFTATIEQGSLSWASTLRASFKDRLTMTAQVERIDRQTDAQPDDTLAFRELYTAVGAGTAYERTLPTAWGSLTLNTGLGVSGGLGDDDAARTTADLGYFLARPDLGLALKTRGDLTVSLRGFGQVSGDVVPEQKQWVVGGTRTLHAFLPGVASGDEGYAARLEVAASALSLGPVQVTPRAFVETATVESNAQDVDGVTLSDGGVALDWDWSGYVNGMLAYAEPIDDDDLNDAVREASEAKLLFAISLNMHAW